MQATLQKLDAEVHDLLEQLRLVDEALTRYLCMCARVHTRSHSRVRAHKLAGFDICRLGAGV